MHNNFQSPPLSSTSTIDRLLGIEQALDWHKDNFSLTEINQFLSQPKDEYDFRMYNFPLKSKLDLKKAIAAAKAAMENLDAPWMMIQCTCCEGQITLSHREVLWYKKNSYGYPSFCEECLVKITKR